MPVEPQKVAVKEKPEVTKAPPKKVASSYILTKSEAQKRLSSGATLFDIPLPLRNSRNEAL